MALYRVTFTTDLLVEADSESEAIRIGDRNLPEEVTNRRAFGANVKHITSADQLFSDERGSLPWRDSQRNLNGEPEKTVDEILGR